MSKERTLKDFSCGIVNKDYRTLTKENLREAGEFWLKSNKTVFCDAREFIRFFFNIKDVSSQQSEIGEKQ